jgi:hypothetical protein
VSADREEQDEGTRSERREQVKKVPLFAFPLSPSLPFVVFESGEVSLSLCPFFSAL